MNTNSVNSALCAALGLDASKVVSLDIHVEGGKLPRVTVVLAVRSETLDGLTATLTTLREEYELIKRS